MISTERVASEEPLGLSGVERGPRRWWRGGGIAVAALPGILVATAILLPFIGKAFTIDDPVFLLSAQHARVDPLHPYAFDISWESETPRRVSIAVPSGPVMAWLLVPAVMSTAPEHVAHAITLAMLWLGIAATAALASRLGLSRTWSAVAGVLVACLPAVLGMSGTAMPDVPAMALAVAGVERFVAWHQDRRFHQAALATVLLAAAALTRTHAVLLLAVPPLLVGTSFPHVPRRRSEWVAWAPAACAMLLITLVTIITRDPDARGGSLADAVASRPSLEGAAPNLVAFFVHWVLAVPLAIPWLVTAWRRILHWWLVFIAVTLASAAVLRWHPGGPRASLLIAPMAGLGAVVLVDILVEARRRRDAVQGTLGLWLLIGAPAAFYVQLPSKYLVASAPAVAILLAREAMRIDGRLRRSLTLAVPVALGVLLGTAILRADDRFSSMARFVARDMIQPAVARGQRVWYVGHWGFQWYAERAGARPVLSTPPWPAEGDLIFASDRSDAPRRIMAVVERQRYLVGYEDREPGGRLMDHAAGAGFYSNSWGYLPWSWGHEPLERIDVWQVAPRSHPSSQ